MIRFLLVAAAALAAGSCAEPARAATCADLPTLADGRSDASEALADCIRRTPDRGSLTLRPGTYRLRQPLRIDRPLSLTTQGVKPGDPGCALLGEPRCATLLLDPANPTTDMPITVTADDVRISHLVVRGSGQARRLRASCGREGQRPGGGGIRVTGSAFALGKSVIRDVTCYTALEVTSSARAPRIEDNRIGPNGDHRPGEIWADGVTIHDSTGAIVRGNHFIDNTDVQLILGGCRDCRIHGNAFAHGGSVPGGSFAELMLHSWPNTSGDFTGTTVTANRIDCGPERRCGYGLMIGAAPWYPGRMSGGTIRGNLVRNAQMGINIDGLTGPVEISGNRILAAGGRSPSRCGPGPWPAANIAPASRRFVRGDPSDQSEAAISTARCLLNR